MAGPSVFLRGRRPLRRVLPRFDLRPGFLLHRGQNVRQVIAWSALPGRLVAFLVLALRAHEHGGWIVQGQGVGPRQVRSARYGSPCFVFCACRSWNRGASFLPTSGKNNVDLAATGPRLVPVAAIRSSGRDCTSCVP
jgi:hypothetical protein